MDCYSICLPERIEYVKLLEEKIQFPINIFNAIQGEKYREYFRAFRHVLSNNTITYGMIGCVLSHIQILKKAKTNILLFEDDCEYVSDCSEFVINAPDYDILCLGTNENVDYDIFDSYVKVTRFWGTHALLIKYSAIEKILQTFERYASMNIFLPADWLYSIAIKEHNLRAFAPINPKQYFKQKSSLVSSVNGKVRD
jgi:GR25 family glycosyltransferase involved in LPS biosynthesis